MPYGFKSFTVLGMKRPNSEQISLVFFYQKVSIVNRTVDDRFILRTRHEVGYSVDLTLNCHIGVTAPSLIRRNVCLPIGT